MTKTKKLFKTLFFFITLFLFVLPFKGWGQTEKEFLRKGNFLYKGGKYPDAEINYRKALTKNNNSAIAYYNLGAALYKQKQYKEASKQFYKSSSLFKTEKQKAYSWYNYANCLYKMNKMTESINAYKNTLKLYPYYSKAQYNLAIALNLQKKNENKKKNDPNNKKMLSGEKGDDKAINRNLLRGRLNDNGIAGTGGNSGGLSKEDADKILRELDNQEKDIHKRMNKESDKNKKIKKNW